MNLDIDRELIIEGVARGLERFLGQSGSGQDFAKFMQMLTGAGLLKQGLLNADQASDLLGISRRTFDRKVADGLFRKVETLGRSEPRFWVMELIQDLEAMRQPGKSDQATLDLAALNFVDLAGGATVAPEHKRRGRRPKAA